MEEKGKHFSEKLDKKFWEVLLWKTKQNQDSWFSPRKIFELK
jgi:hypothetical protein